MVTSNTQNTAVSHDLTTRPPIVVVLGHVDHGKSSLLEAIREDFQITARESGGITQHIGAYVAEYQGKSITFLDTPGHEAFSVLRSRGAKVADIAVLVVAADEGIQPQTKEAIEIVKKAGVPFVVAVNKIDKPGADVNRIHRELAVHEVFVEQMGGKVPAIGTSALTKEGIPQLLEMIFLVAELESLKGNPENPAKGVAIEIFADAKRGLTATLLIREGTLRAGDIVGTKSSWGKVRILENFQGLQAKHLGPGLPARVVGFEESLQQGEEFQVFAQDEDAKRNIVLSTPRQKIQQVLETQEGKEVVNVILKADVGGSLEALEELFLSLPQENAIVRIVGSGIGQMNESDLKLAQTTRAKVFGFRTNISRPAKEFAEREGMNVEIFDVIYDLIQSARKLLEKSEEPSVAEQQIGTLQVLAVFFSEKNRQIVGGRVQEGRVQKGARIEIARQDTPVGKGKVVNLQKDKKDVSEVGKGEECGILYEGDIQVQPGDALRFFVQGLIP